MWVRITARTRSRFSGILENNPAVLDYIREGDQVDFRSFHIIQTSLPDPDLKAFSAFLGEMCLVSPRIYQEDLPVSFAYRTTAEDGRPAFWTLFGGGEDTEKVVFRKYTHHDMLHHDASLQEILHTAPPCAFEKLVNGSWARLSKRELREFTGEA